MWVPIPPHSRGREKWLSGKETRDPAVHTRHWAAIQGVTVPNFSDPLCHITSPLCSQGNH